MGLTGQLVSFPVTLESMQCASCGCQFAIPAAMARRYREDGAFVRCPNPKCEWPSFHIVENVVAKLERQLRDQKAALEREQQSHQMTKNMAKAEAKKAARIAKRIHAGVCPKCNRTFQQLARHMKSKHGGPKCTTS
jgi:RNase P subunit RPR2